MSFALVGDLWVAEHEAYKVISIWWGCLGYIYKNHSPKSHDTSSHKEVFIGTK
jgi:hypothetical protein